MARLHIRGGVTGLAALVLAAAVSACGGDAPASAPTVSSTSPANAAIGVAINSGFAVTFSEAMDPASITGATFTLTGPGAAAVAGTVTALGRSGLFKPAASLLAGTPYTATIAIGARSAAGRALATSHSWQVTTGATADTTAPVASSTIPENGATSVVTNGAITVTFSEPMAPATLTAATFGVTAPGAAPVAGTVTCAGLTAVFQPASALPTGTSFTATITTGARDLAGNALAAGHAWSFTTGGVTDATAPTVTSTGPAAAATGVLTTADVQAAFSEAMMPRTLDRSTFTLTGPGGAPVPGTVVLDGPAKVATFRAATSLAANTRYQARIRGGAGGVADLAGNPMASDHTWSFTSGAFVGLSPVLLGSAANYAVLAKSAISTVPSSKVTGDLALSPAAQTYITGFGLTGATGYATSPQVVGKVYAADQTPPTPSTLTTAVGDMETAYTDAAGRPTPDFLELSTGAIGGLDLRPGLYKWTGDVTIPSDVTLTGGAGDVWILQISGNLTMSSARKVLLGGGALARNVFWQVAGAVDIGTGAHFEGILLCQTAIALRTSASMNGRALAQTAVTLDAVTLTQPTAP